jgi:hypothetical protein
MKMKIEPQFWDELQELFSYYLQNSYIVFCYSNKDFFLNVYIGIVMAHMHEEYVDRYFFL